MSGGEAGIRIFIVIEVVAGIEASAAEESEGGDIAVFVEAVVLVSESTGISGYGEGVVVEREIADDIIGDISGFDDVVSAGHDIEVRTEGLSSAAARSCVGEGL